MSGEDLIPNRDDDDGIKINFREIDSPNTGKFNYTLSIIIFRIRTDVATINDVGVKEWSSKWPEQIMLKIIYRY